MVLCENIGMAHRSTTIAGTCFIFSCHPIELASECAKYTADFGQLRPGGELQFFAFQHEHSIFGHFVQSFIEPHDGSFAPRHAGVSWMHLGHSLKYASEK
jgi:hypothetical protein